MTEIQQVLFDTDDELNNRLYHLKEAFVLRQKGQLKEASARVITIFPRGDPNAPGRKILPQYEAWVEIRGDV